MISWPVLQLPYHPFHSLSLPTNLQTHHTALTPDVCICSSLQNSLSSGTYMTCVLISFTSLFQSHFMREEFTDKIISPYAAHYLLTPCFFFICTFCHLMYIYLLVYLFLLSPLEQEECESPAFEKIS